MYFLSLMLCPNALRPKTQLCCALRWCSWRSAMSMCLSHVTASLRLRLQEVCGWLLLVKRRTCCSHANHVLSSAPWLGPSLKVPHSAPCFMPL